MVNDSKEEGTPLIRGGIGNRRRQRKDGETFSLFDDQRTLHRPQNLSEESSSDRQQNELQRDYSRFVIYGGDPSGSDREGRSSKASSASGTSSSKSRQRSHRGQWSSTTEPTKNMSLASISKNRMMNQEGGLQHQRGDASHNQLQFRRDYIAMMKTTIIVISYSILVAYSILVCAGPLFLTAFGNKGSWCPDHESVRFGQATVSNDDDAVYEEPHYENPDYITDPCFHRRLPQLLFLTLEECDLSRRMLYSVVLGGAIGYERRASDRPAGIRTMGLVSLGSCFFTISSQLAFKSSTMGWDASRVTAALPTGVGFLGAGLIWKGTIGTGPEEVHQVHGLTTAASLWLSAAVGAGSGGALYMVSGYSVILIIIILRYGPKLYMADDSTHSEGSDYEGGDEFFDYSQGKGSIRDGRLDGDRPLVAQTAPPMKSSAVRRHDSAFSHYTNATVNEDGSFEGDESLCPSFVSFTDFQAAAETDELLTSRDSHVSSPPPRYGSTEPEKESPVERPSILKSPRNSESLRSRKKLQLTFESADGRTPSAPPFASPTNSSRRSSLRKFRHKSVSKRPTFHS